MKRAGAGVAQNARGLAAAAVAAVAIAAGALGPACRRSKGSGPGIDRERAAALFTEVPVATAPGLSGLAADAGGALWTVAERDARAYRIVLDASLRPAIEEFRVEGVLVGFDLEGIAWLGEGRFALGTEGQDDGTATVLLAERRGAALAVTGSIALPASAVGIRLTKNQGAEGVCGAGATIIAAIEGAGEDGGRRWAPVVRISDGAIARTYRVWLTTPTGKLSGLDCRVAADGAADVWAIERHFEVTRLLRFALPAASAGAGADSDVTPTVALDLGPVLNGKLNLEGIAVLPDGRVVAVIDNQYTSIDPPESELLVFRPEAVRGSDAR